MSIHIGNKIQPFPVNLTAADEVWDLLDGKTFEHMLRSRDGLSILAVVENNIVRVNKTSGNMTLELSINIYPPSRSSFSISNDIQDIVELSGQRLLILLSSSRFLIIAERSLDSLQPYSITQYCLLTESSDAVQLESAYEKWFDTCCIEIKGVEADGSDRVYILSTSSKGAIKSFVIENNSEVVVTYHRDLYNSINTIKLFGSVLFTSSKTTSVKQFTIKSGEAELVEDFGTLHNVTSKFDHREFTVITPSTFAFIPLKKVFIWETKANTVHGVCGGSIGSARHPLLDDYISTCTLISPVSLLLDDNLLLIAQQIQRDKPILRQVLLTGKIIAEGLKLT